MSATANAAHFAAYFSTVQDDVPSVVVPGKTFPVTASYLEDIIEATSYVLESTSEYCLPKQHLRHEAAVTVSGKGGRRFQMNVKWEESAEKKELLNADNAAEQDSGSSDDSDMNNVSTTEIIYSERTFETISRMDTKKINFDLILILIQHIHSTEPAGGDTPGCILVFLPGFAEITTLLNILSVETSNRSSKSEKPPKWYVLPLHSTLTNSDQSKVFQKPPKGFRKIILSTNVAETGTICIM